MIMTKPTHIDSRVKQSHTETNEFSAFQSQMSHLIPTLHLYSMNVTDDSKENKYEYTVTDNSGKDFYTDNYITFGDFLLFSVLCHISVRF